MELKNFTRKENGSVVAELYLKETESTLTLTYTLNKLGFSIYTMEFIIE